MQTRTFGRGRPPRLPGHDCAGAAAYFITMVVEGRRQWLARIERGRLEPSPLGCIVREEWRNSAALRREVILDRFVVMPDHCHAIVFMCPEARATPRNAAGPVLWRPPRSLGAMIAQFKATSTSRMNAVRGTPGERIWQTGYYDRIIRDERALACIRRYIDANPARWRGV